MKTSAAKIMKTVPSRIAVQPAAEARGRSPAPTAWPTRTAPADPSPSGIMNATPARLSAIWCAALEIGSSVPDSAVASANTPTSAPICDAAGSPSASSLSQPRGVECAIDVP